MRERLKDLFKNINYKPFENCTMESSVANQFTEYALDHIVDELIANGVILPPCKVDDILYFIEDCTGHMERRVTGFTQNKILSYAMEFDMSKFGKTLFPEKEEAIKMKEATKK